MGEAMERRESGARNGTNSNTKSTVAEMEAEMRRLRMENEFLKK